MNAYPRFSNRHLTTLAGLLLLAWPALAAEVSAPAPKSVAFENHDGYFVSNQFEAKAPASFVVIHDQASFDKVFGVGMVMGDKSHRLPANAFDKKIVVAAIHRGKAMVTYQVKSVSSEGHSLVVRYTTEAKPDATAEFACPLILSLDKGKFQTVRFIENGKDIKHLPATPPHAANPGNPKPPL